MSFIFSETYIMYECTVCTVKLIAELVVKIMQRGLCRLNKVL